MGQPVTPSENMQMMTELLKDGYTDDMYYKIMDFWDDPELVQWFHSHGYTLYNRVSENDRATVPALPFDEITVASYPYAHHDAREFWSQSIPLRARDPSGKVVYAQDSEQRHVAIKLVLDNSDEYRIFHFLHEVGFDTLRENCIIPVLDLVRFQDFWLAVMPRWGNRIDEPRNHTIRELLKIMHSMLKGLAFLHANNIIHRDMKIANMLINHFADDEARYEDSNTSDPVQRFYPSPRAELRKEGKLLYALMDFNISIMVPRDIKKEEYRRHYHDAFAGSGYHPSDTMQGEFDYNPFAFDVGTLGVVFCHEYQHYARHIPMLAPLLDKMTTRDIENRFTAAEALCFFEEMMLPSMTEDQLNLEEYENPEGYTRYDLYNRWQGLPEDFQQKWSAYRQLPTPITAKVLRAIRTSEYVPHYFLPSIRWFLFKLTIFPRYIWTRFVGFIGFR